MYYVHMPIENYITKWPVLMFFHSISLLGGQQMDPGPKGGEQRQRREEGGLHQGGAGSRQRDPQGAL